MKIVLFGKMRSGKDTVGKILIDEYGFNRFAFGEGIGEIIETFFPEALREGKPRHHYQFIGQQLRQLDQDVWIKYLLKRVEKMEAENDCLINVVVTDGRQINEAEKLKAEGYVVVKVEAPEDLRLKRIRESGDSFNIEQLNHETELQVDQVVADYIIKNDGTLEELEYKVMETVLMIMAKEKGMSVSQMVNISLLTGILYMNLFGGGMGD